MDRKDVVRWVIEKSIEILAKADEYRSTDNKEISEQLAFTAGSLIQGMYVSFDFDNEFISELEGIRGGFEATSSWKLANVISELHRAYHEWVASQGTT